jgi:hypothetical protein
MPIIASKDLWGYQGHSGNIWVDLARHIDKQQWLQHLYRMGQSVGWEFFCHQGVFWHNHHFSSHNSCISMTNICQPDISLVSIRNQKFHISMTTIYLLASASVWNSTSNQFATALFPLPSTLTQSTLCRFCMYPLCWFLDPLSSSDALHCSGSFYAELI